MKKFSFALLTAFVLLFAACEKDPDDNQPSTQPDHPDYASLVVGSWTIDSDSSTTHEVFTSPIENWDDFYTLKESGFIYGEFVFQPDGSGSLTAEYVDEGQYTDPIRYAVFGDTLSFGPDENYKIENINFQRMALFMEGHIIDEGADYYYSVRYILHRKGEKDVRR